jgi:hypothetical protein
VELAVTPGDSVLHEGRTFPSRAAAASDLQLQISHSYSRSRMAWAGATGKTAITMSRFIRGIFSAKRGGLLEARRRTGIPERNSRLVLAMFPGSGALLPCNHHNHAGPFWLLNIAQEARFQN